MADLPNGTTIGGKKIIHKGIANNHRHSASDIDGLNTLATGSQGDGGGIDANVLSGNTYGDLSNEFLLTENDTIPELILANHPTQNRNAVSRLYLQNSIPQNVRSGEFYGITSIGDQSSTTYDYSVLDSYNIRFSEMECLINGSKYTIPTDTFDIRDVNANFENKVFYTYVQIEAGIADIRIKENFEVNEDNKIFIGTLETNATSIDTYTPISGIGRVGVGRYMLSNTPKEYAIPVSDSNGKIDNAWIYGARGETLVTLNGPTEISSGGTFSYLITNYNSFSEYELPPSDAGFGVSFSSEDIIEVIGPNTIPFETQTDLVVLKDGFENVFTITLVADPSVTISGPTEINSGGGNYQYTIGNYNPDYTYTVTTTHGTVSRTDDIITLITPATLENDVTATITVTREGSSDSINTLILAVPPYDVVGRDEVWPGADFQYTIDPYDSTMTYNISTSFPYTFSGGIITISVPPGTENEYTETLSVTSGSIVVEKTITILGKPDPIDITDFSGGNLVIYDAIGMPEPGLHYTVNVYGNYSTVEGGLIYAAIRTENYFLFTEGSELTLNIYNANITSHGGSGGGNYRSNDGSPGGTCIYVSAVPTNLTINGCTVRAGGGGGGGAVRYTATSSNAGKGGDTSYSTNALGPGGGGRSITGRVATVTDAIGNVSTTNATQGTSSSAGVGGSARHTEEETRYDSNNNPYTVNHTFDLYGGNGGAYGSPGASSTGSSNVETVSYQLVGGAVTSSSGRSGDLGVGGAAGYAIQDSGGNIQSFTNINSTVIGRSDV